MTDVKDKPKTNFKVNGLKFSTDGSLIKLETNLPKSVDRRKPSKNKGKGTINTNPKKSDCLGWYDKKQDKWVYKWDEEVESNE